MLRTLILAASLLRLSASPGIVYGDATWTALVRDSYAFVGGKPEQFERWLQPAWQKTTGKTFKEWLAEKRKELKWASDNPKATNRAEIKICGELHAALKKTVTKFDLDRGYEFAWMEQRGERQCLLQSVFIAAALQRMGIPAGIAMVWRSPNGAESTLGHVVAIATLPKNQRLVVDASEPSLNVNPQGMFLPVVSPNHYRFVTVSYQKDGTLAYAEDFETHARYSPSQLGTLPVSYVKSQFLFYRAERIVGGLLAQPPTADGLAKSERWMRASAAADPRNPLTTYSVGRVLVREGKVAEAAKWGDRAEALFRSYGYMPPGLVDFQKATHRG